MVRHISKEDILKAAEKFRNHTDQSVDGRLYFWSGGTGVPDDVAVEYFKGTGIIVITRDGTKWLNGEKLKD